MNEYIYVIRPTRVEMLIESTPEEDAITMAHFEYLKGLADEGVMLLAGRTLTTGEQSFGIAIFQAESDEAMQAIAVNDPAVKQKQFRAELYPYRIALLDAGNV